MILLLFGVLSSFGARATTSHDFAACVRYLDGFAEETIVRRPVSEVPADLRRHFDGAVKVMLIGANPSRAGEVFYITHGDLKRDQGAGPLHLRLARIDDAQRDQVEICDWGRPHTLVARRHYPPRAARTVLTPEEMRGLRVGDVIERFGVYYVLDRASSDAGSPRWQLEAYRFKQVPRVGDRANQTATVVAGDCTWIGTAVIGRHANVIAVDFDGVPRTRLDLTP